MVINLTIFRIQRKSKINYSLDGKDTAIFPYHVKDSVAFLCVFGTKESEKILTIWFKTLVPKCPESYLQDNFKATKHD